MTITVHENLRQLFNTLAADCLSLSELPDLCNTILTQGMHEPATPTEIQQQLRTICFQFEPRIRLHHIKTAHFNPKYCHLVFRLQVSQQSNDLTLTDLESTYEVLQQQWHV